MHVSKSILALALLLVIVLTGAVGFLLGQQSGVPEKNDSKLLVSPTPQSFPITESTAVQRSAQVRMSPTSPPIDIGTLKEADYRELGSGCMCTFARKGVDYLVGGGDDRAFIRVDGRVMMTPLPEEALQKMFDDDFRYQARGYSVAVRRVSKTAPGFDGHASEAELKISAGRARR